MPRSKAQIERNKKMYAYYKKEYTLGILLQHEIFTKLARRHGLSHVQVYRIIKMMKEQELQTTK